MQCNMSVTYMLNMWNLSMCLLLITRNSIVHIYFLQSLLFAQGSF